MRFFYVGRRFLRFVLAKNSESAAHHRMVPSAWVEELRLHWHTIAETEVEGRLGSRGAWHSIPNTRLAISHLEGADDVAEMQLSLSHAQSCYDKAWAWRDEQGKRCDVKLCLYQRVQGKGFVKLTEIIKGGRLDDDEATDVPDEYGGFSPLSVWKQTQEERNSLIGHIDTLIQRNIDLSGSVVQMAHETKSSREGEDMIRAIETEQVGKYARMERGLESVERLLERYEQPLKDFAEAKKADSFIRTPRPKTGDAVRDSWDLCISVCDLPTANLIRERWPDAGNVLCDAWASDNLADRDAIVDLWIRLRPKLEGDWKKNLAALPGPLREAMVQLVVAVSQVEEERKKNGRAEEATVAAP